MLDWLLFWYNKYKKINIIRIDLNKTPWLPNAKDFKINKKLPKENLLLKEADLEKIFSLEIIFLSKTVIPFSFLETEKFTKVLKVNINFDKF